MKTAETKTQGPRPKTATTWRRRPRRGKHPILGARLTWTRKDGGARVDRFLGGSKCFIAIVAIAGTDNWYPLPGNFSKLRTAQGAADRRLRKAAESTTRRIDHDE